MRNFAITTVLLLVLLLLSLNCSVAGDLEITVFDQSGKIATGALVQIFPGAPNPDDDIVPIEPAEPRSDGVIGFEIGETALRVSLPSGEYSVFAFSKRGGHRFALLDTVYVGSGTMNLLLSARDAASIEVRATDKMGAPADAAEVFFRPFRNSRGSVGFVDNDGKLVCRVSRGIYNVVLASSLHYLYLIHPHYEITGDQMIVFSPSEMPTSELFFDVPPGSFPAMYEVLTTTHTNEVIQAIEETVGYDAAYTRVYALITPQIPVVVSAGYYYSISLSYLVTRDGESFAYEIRPPGEVLQPQTYRYGNTGEEPFTISATPSRSRYEPGERVELKFRIEDTRGNMMGRAFNFSSARLVFPYCIVRDPEGRVVADNREQIVGDPVPERFFGFEFRLPDSAVEGEYSVECAIDIGIYGTITSRSKFLVEHTENIPQILSVDIPQTSEAGRSTRITAKFNTDVTEFAEIELQLSHDDLTLSPQVSFAHGTTTIWNISLPQPGIWQWQVRTVSKYGSETSKQGEIEVIDTEPPVVELLLDSPLEWGMSERVEVVAQDNIDVKRVWLIVTNSGVSSEIEGTGELASNTTSKFVFLLPAWAVTPGISIVARATDGSNNTGESRKIEPIVRDTTPPTIENVSINDRGDRLVFMAVISDNRGISRAVVETSDGGSFVLSPDGGISRVELPIMEDFGYAIEVADQPDNEGIVRTTRYPETGYATYLVEPVAALTITPPGNGDRISLHAGDSVVFRAEVIGESGAILSVPVRWYVTNGIGSISQDGRFQATLDVPGDGSSGGIRNGEIGVVALRKDTNGDLPIATVPVSVLPAEPDHVSVIPEFIDCESGHVVPILVMLFDRFGNRIDVSPDSFRFNLSPTNIGEIAGDRFLAKRAGTGTLTVGYGDLQSTVELRVREGRIARLEISPNRLNVIAGEKAKLTARAFDAQGNEFPVHPEWAAYGGIGQISADGVFLARKAGTGKISAFLGGVVAEITVAVSPGALSSMTMEPYVEYLPMSTETQIRRKMFTLFGWDAQWNAVPLGKVKWSTDPLAGEIDDSGIFTATDETNGAAVGGVVINGSVFAHSKGNFAKSVVVIQLKPPGVPKRLEILPEGFPSKPSKTVVSVGQRVDIEVTAFDSKGNRMSVIPEWRLSGDIGYMTGESTFVATKPGIGNVSASAWGLSDTLPIEVTPGELADIRLTPSYVDARVGDEIHIVAAGYDVSENAIPISGIAWSSPGGIFRATEPGYHTVEARIGGHTAYAVIHVGHGKPEKATITPAGTVRLPAGETIRFTAAACDSFGNPLPIVPAWRVEGRIGRIAADGTFLATRSGSGKIAVRFGTIEASTSVIVSAGKAIELIASPGRLSVQGGESISLSAFVLDGFGNLSPVSPEWNCPSTVGDITADGVLKVNATPVAGLINVVFGEMSTTIAVEPANRDRIQDVVVLPKSSDIPIYCSQRYLEIAAADGRFYPLESIALGNVIIPDRTGTIPIISKFGGAKASLDVSGVPGVVDVMNKTVYMESGEKATTSEIRVVEGTSFGYLVATDARLGWDAVAGYEIDPIQQKSRVLYPTKIESPVGEPIRIFSWPSQKGSELSLNGIDGYLRSDGVLIPFDPGQGWISNGVDKTELIIRPREPVMMVVRPNMVFVPPGLSSTIRFNISFLDREGNPQNFTAPVKWHLIGSIGQVSGDGVLTINPGLAEGMEGEIVAVCEQLNLSARARVRIGEKSGNVREIHISPSVSEVVRGESIKFDAVGFDDNGRQVAITPTWQVFDDAGAPVPAISSDGYLDTSQLALGKNYAIRVSAGDLVSDEITLKVVTGTLRELRSNADSIVLKPGDSARVEIAGYDLFGNPVPLNNTSWSGGDGIFEISFADDDSAIIRGENPGKARLTIRNSGCHLFVNVSVVRPEGFRLFSPAHPDKGSQENPITVDAGALIPIATEPNITITLQIEGETGKILPTGDLILTKAGNYRVIAQSDQSMDDLHIRVLPGRAAQITINPSITSLEPGATQRFTVVVADRFGNKLPNAEVLWQVVGEGEIASDGVYRASQREGISQVIAIVDDNLHAVATISVVSEIGSPVKLLMETDRTQVAAGESFVLNVSGMDEKGNVVTELTGLSVAVEPESASATQISATSWRIVAPTLIPNDGIITLTATLGDLSTIEKLAVVAGQLAKIEVTPATARVTAGESMNFEALGWDRYGNPVEISPTWQLDTGLGEISTTGTYLAKGAGTEKVQALSNGVLGTAEITVEPGTPHSVSIQPESTQVKAGSRIKLKAVVVDSFGNEIESPELVWSAGAGGVIEGSGGTVDFIGIKSGNVTVKVSHGDLSASITIEVVTGEIVRIKLLIAGEIRDSFEAFSGRSYELTLVGSDAGGNIVPVTGAEWRLSGEIGEIHPLDNGSARFNATFIGSGRLSVLSGGVSSEVSVTVVPEKLMVAETGASFRGDDISIIVPEGAHDGALEISISVIRPSGFQEMAKPASRVYRIAPTKTVFRKPILVGIKPTNDEIPVSPAFWDEYRRRWTRISAEKKEGGFLFCSVNHLGDFAIVSGEFRVQPAGSLRITDLQIDPNPFFAPESNRMTISYVLVTDDGGFAEVSIRLLGMNGELLWILSDEPRSPGRHVEMWDGRTPDGRLVGNGRYFLILTAKKDGQGKTIRKSMAVFK